MEINGIRSPKPSLRKKTESRKSRYQVSLKPIVADGTVAGSAVPSRMEIAARRDYDSDLSQLLIGQYGNQPDKFKDPMKDIVEEALAYDAQEDVSDEVSSDEFGPPRFLYIGVGAHGLKRLKSGLDSPETHTAPRQAVEDVVTKVAFRSSSDRSLDEPDRVDQYVDNPDSLAELATEIDCCVITANLDDRSVIADVLAVADAIQDSLVIAVLTTNTDNCGDIDRRIHESVGTAVLIRDMESHFDVCRSLTRPHVSSIDQLVQRLVTDFVSILVGPNLVPVDYASVRSMWNSGRSAVPFAGKFHESDLGNPDYSSSISFIGPSTQTSTDWFGYAWIGPSFTMADFEQFWGSLDRTIRSNTKDRSGILGCGISEQLENSIFVSGVRFVDADIR